MNISEIKTIPAAKTGYEAAKAAADAARARSRELGKAMSAFPKLANGLTPDEVKATPAWRAAKKEYDAAFAAEQAANANVVKRFPKEHRADLDAQRKQRSARA